MTRGSIQEYAQVVRGRYLKGDKKEKGKILSEFVKVTGYNRQSAIRLLRRSKVPPGAPRRGRTGGYRPKAIGILVVLWAAANRICSKRLQPFISELLAVLLYPEVLHGEPGIAAELKQMSPSPIDRSALRTPLWSSYAPIDREVRGGRGAPPSQARC